MIYLIGGAPRVGKSILCQQFAATLSIGWVSTDLLLDLLRLKQEKGVKTEWNANLKSIRANTDWFFPYLDRFLWGISLMTESYVLEGVDFLPEQVKQLSSRYQIQSVFLGCSQMMPEMLIQLPGHSPGYTVLPESLRRKIAEDVPVWSDFIRQEAEQFDYPYIDTSNDFVQRLADAEALLTKGV